MYTELNLFDLHYAHSEPNINRKNQKHKHVTTIQDEPYSLTKRALMLRKPNVRNDPLLTFYHLYGMNTMQFPVKSTNSKILGRNLIYIPTKLDVVDFKNEVTIGELFVH